MNLAFNLGETIPKSKIVRKVLRSLPERFHAKITAIEELKDIDKILLTDFVGNLQTIGKSKALTATLSDTKPEDDFDNEDDEILNAFIAIVNPTEGIVEDVDEEEELMEFKFEKMDEQDDIHTAYAKL